MADTILANSGADRTTSFAYAVAWTQHTNGPQIIGCCALLQLLLGNFGRPGAGIMALRGHASIQGSTDVPTLPDFAVTKPPTAKAVQGGIGLDAHSGTDAFIMKADGVAWLYVPSGPMLGAVMVGLAGIFNFRNRGVSEPREPRP